MSQENERNCGSWENSQSRSWETKSSCRSFDETRRAVDDFEVWTLTTFARLTNLLWSDLHCSTFSMYCGTLERQSSSNLSSFQQSTWSFPFSGSTTACRFNHKSWTLKVSDLKLLSTFFFSNFALFSSKTSCCSQSSSNFVDATVPEGKEQRRAECSSIAVPTSNDRRCCARIPSESCQFRLRLVRLDKRSAEPSQTSGNKLDLIGFRKSQNKIFLMLGDVELLVSAAETTAASNKMLAKSSVVIFEKIKPNCFRIVTMFLLLLITIMSKKRLQWAWGRFMNCCCCVRLVGCDVIHIRWLVATRTFTFGSMSLANVPQTIILAALLLVFTRFCMHVSHPFFSFHHFWVTTKALKLNHQRRRENRLDFTLHTWMKITLRALLSGMKVINEEPTICHRSHVSLLHFHPSTLGTVHLKLMKSILKIVHCKTLLWRCFYLL